MQEDVLFLELSSGRGLYSRAYLSAHVVTTNSGTRLIW